MDPDKIFEAFTNGIGESIVNPRCDNCGRSLNTPSPDEIGIPRLCRSCEDISAYEHRAGFNDYMSQERPRGRTIHKVKLPPGGLK